MLCLLASASAARLSPPTASIPSKQRSRKGDKKVLMLISDTGGGHRASALALEAAMLQQRPKGMEVKVVDIWTEYATWPSNKMAAGYPFVCKYPWIWRSMYYTTKHLERPWVQLLRASSGGGFKRCIEEYDPDMVVSLHPLCQNLPLHNLRTLAKKRGDASRQIPFAVVCTDLGSAHPSWFHKDVDLCFVASEAVQKLARKRGIIASKLRNYGLPVRKAFWKASERSGPASQELRAELGLQPDLKTVLVMGGGDGVGSLGSIVEATAAQLAKDCPGTAQVVAICGKNKQVKAKLEAMEWDGVRVEVRGFCSAMSDYMEAADCLVTKAGPGTIAEAAIRGLPTMLSTHLPGQEAGNVPFVVNKGFGEFSRKPDVIAQTVSGWLKDENELARKSAAALAAGQPDATSLIAKDLVVLLDEWKP